MSTDPRDTFVTGFQSDNQFSPTFFDKVTFSTCHALPDCLNDRSRQSDGPFVYRLGRQVFNLERGVRFPYGLPFSFIENRGVGCGEVVRRDMGCRG